MTLIRSLVLFSCVLLFAGCWGTPDQTSNVDEGQGNAEVNVEPTTETTAAEQTSNSPVESVADNSQPASIELLTQNSLEGWETANFGGERECTVEAGVLTIEAGYPLSGVVTTREDLPVVDFEISLEAKRSDGVDFFCGLTFPVGEGHCTFIVGGWAGAIVGLSCIDGKDAARNETKTLMNFKDDQWYRVKVRVDSHVTAWIDDEQVARVAREGREFTLRNETLVTRPYGLCTFETTAHYRNIKLTKLTPTE